MPEYTVFLSGSRFLTTAKLQSKLEKKGQALQIYRKRHLDAGVIAAPRRGGEIVFNVPLYEPRTLPNHL